MTCSNESVSFSVDFSDIKIKAAFEAAKKYLKKKMLKTFKRRLFFNTISNCADQDVGSVSNININKFKRNINLRMDVLRKLCNIPHCRFSKLPVPVLVKYGYNFLNINKAIDAYLDSKVGSNTSEPSEILGHIEGSTLNGDGFIIKQYTDNNLCDIFINFNDYASSGYKFKMRLQRQINRITGQSRTFVYAAKVGVNKKFSYWCDKFLLSERKTPGQMMVMDLLCSVAMRVPDVLPGFQSGYRRVFSKSFNNVREAFIKECQKFYADSLKELHSVKARALRQNVSSNAKSAHNCTVTLKTADDGRESFVVKFGDGRMRIIENNDYAVRNLFNATLNNGKYYIHPRAMIPSKSFFSSKKSEYCWLDAFAMAGKKIPDHVIPYPSLRMRVLYSCGLGTLVSKHCRFVRNGLYHFDPNYTTNTRLTSFDGYVGAKVDTDMPSLGKNINVIFDDLIGHYVQGTNLRSDNLLSSNIVNRLSDRINMMFNKEKDLTIQTSLTAAEKRKVIDMFPELNLNFVDSSYSSHPIATAVRTCENYVMAKRHGHRDFIDAGGDVVGYLKNSVSDVHVCTPVVDAKDSHRHMTRSSLLDTMWGLKEKISFCEKKTEDCCVEKTNIVAVEVYDMTLRQMAQALLSHKAKRFDFSLIIPPEVCDPVCDVYLLNNSLHVVNNGDKIEYIYGDFGESYFHDRENLRDILRTQMFVHNGVVFKKTLECSREHLHFFSLVPCLNIRPGVYTLSTHYKKSESDKLEMTIPVREKLGQIVDKRTSVDKSLTYSLIEYVMNTAARVDEKSSDYLISQYRAKKSMTIKGNKVVQTDNELAVELVPGYLAIILAEGLRLREKIQYFAKVSYHRHYSPSIVKIFSLLIQEFTGFVRNNLYNGFIWVLRQCLSDKLLDKVISGERRIHDCQYIMRFKQEVTVVGESGKYRILGDSISAFVEASEKAAEGFSDLSDRRPDLFKRDDYDKLYDLIHSGGGNSGFFNGNIDYCSPFSFYCGIYNFVSKLVDDASKVSLYTNFIVSVVDWLRYHAVSCTSYIREVFDVIVAAIRGRLTSAMRSLWDKLKKCAKEMKTRIEGDRKSLEDEISRIFDMERLDEAEKAISESYAEDVAVLKEQLVTTGGGYRVRVMPGWLQMRCEILRHRLHAMLQSLKLNLKLLWRNVLYVPEFLRDTVSDLLAAVKLVVFDGKFVEMCIQGAAFFAVNVTTNCMFGRLGLGLSLLSTVVYLAIKLSGLERKFLGCSMVNEHVSAAISTRGIVHPYLIPIRSLVLKSCQNWMKQKLLGYESLAPVATDLIAKDAIGSSVYRHVTPYRVRMGVYFTIFFALWKPALAGMMLVCILLIGEHARYYRTVVVQANVHLSFASKLSRLNPTSKARAIKQLLISKFDRKKVRPEKESVKDDFFDDLNFEEDGDAGVHSKDMVGGDPGDVEDSDVVELDYSGKEVVKQSWADEVEGVILESSQSKNQDGLVFSNLDITSNRERFICDSSLPLSDALLQYPLVDVTTNVLTGDGVLDTFSEFFFLEKKKLHVELGKINNVVDFFKSTTTSKTAFYNKVWSLRNKFDDSTMYVSENSRNWYRLRQGDKGHVQLEGLSKYTSENKLVPFDSFFDGFQVTSDELMGMFSNRRCLALQSIDLSNSNFSIEPLLENVIFYNKPPGAGKTTTIVNNMLRDIKSNVRCLALTCTNAGKKEIVQKLRKGGVNNAFSLVMTYDSFLINGGKMETDMVYCDEIFMIHAGLWLAILSMLQFKTMECYGDKNQIPFINRVPNTICQYSQAVFFWFRMVHDNVSYRCPPDVCYILSNLKDASGNLLYPNGVKSVGPNSGLLRSMFVVPLRSAEEIAYNPEAKMIAFTKPEKDDIMRYGRNVEGKTNSAQTVNEVQGGTFPKVELYRLRQYDNPIYNDVNQFVVSISRHTEIMKYRVLSTKMHDTVGQHIASLDKVADHIIRECAYKQQV